MNENTENTENTELEIETPVEETENKNIHIPANNPDKESMQALCENIQANYNFAVNVTPIDFRFKKSVDKNTGIETTREAVTLAVPVPSVQGVVDILQKDGNEKELALLMDAIESVVVSQCRDLIADDTSINAENFPYDKVSWEAIANMPKAARRGGGIPKETWEAFSIDYITVMQEATGKSLDQVTKAADLLTNRFVKCKTQKDVIKFLVEMLAVYSKTENAVEFQDVLEFLLAKAETLLEAEPANLMDAL